MNVDEAVNEEWERQATQLAERWTMRRAQTLTEFQGRLVPIGELDRAEDLPVREVEVINLTGEPEVIDLTGGLAVINLSGEEECQGHSTQCSQRDECLFCGQTSLTSHCQ